MQKTAYPYVVQDELATTAAWLKALGDPMRLRIAALLAHGELCVCHLVAALAAPQPTVSRQLAVLRHAGVVRARRAGGWSYYALATPTTPLTAPLLAAFMATASADAALRRDVARAKRGCGPTACC